MTATDQPEGPAAAAAGAAGVRGELGPIDVVVLAGGTGRRLEGVSKPDVVARGARLLDHVLTGLDQLRERGLPLGRICVVAPAQVRLPEGVLRALEDPPLGGPVAGIAAGLTRLGARGGAADRIAVLTCDAPVSWRALPELARAAEGHDAGLDGVCAGSAGDGDRADHIRAQYLLGLYRREALAAAVAPGGVPLRDTAVRRALGGLRVVAVPLPRATVQDLDTWAEVRAWDTGAPT